MIVDAALELLPAALQQPTVLEDWQLHTSSTTKVSKHPD